MLRVNFIFRKANPLYFSIEKVFQSVIPFLPKEINVAETYVRSERASLGDLYQNILTPATPADVYHITGDVHYMALAFPSSKTILTIHDCVFMQSYSGLKRIIMKWLWLKIPVMKSRWVTVISEATRQDVIKFTGCNPGKLKVIPDPVSPEFRYVQRKFNKSLPRILQMGTWPNKNLERVIQAMDKINAELVVIGKLNAAQLQMLETSGIRFSNYFNLSEDELVQQYAAADLLIFVSTFEGFGLPIIEAQSTGRVVVTSKLQPMASVAGGAAITVDPYDITSIRAGILEAIQNDELREELIMKGLENVKAYRPEAIALEYFNLYKQL